MRALVVLVFACVLAGSGLASCSSGVRADAGTDAYLQIPGAQFFRGPMPQGSANGPNVDQALLVNDNIWAGLSNDPIGGALDPAATAAAIGLQGDVGYWVVVAGPPAVATPTDPSFAANLVFSQGIILGSYTLVVHAVDGNGDFGPANTQILVAEESPLNPPAKGDLVVTLTWDTESNLSLHVVDPNGADIYWGSQSSQPPFMFNQGDGGSYGYIDYDSNANCVIDGLRREDVLWPDPPPSGQYTVRVDAPSLCGQPIANWKVQVVLEGNEVAQATGVAVDADTMGPHGVGSGVLALQFSVP
ncbi:MAG TPA: hypothetical protein VGL81_22720 [Polyangiaceae bacterium]|jgi:hypothetical protein